MAVWAHQVSHVAKFLNESMSNLRGLQLPKRPKVPGITYWSPINIKQKIADMQAREALRKEEENLRGLRLPKKQVRPKAPSITYWANTNIKQKIADMQAQEALKKEAEMKELQDNRRKRKMKDMELKDMELQDNRRKRKMKLRMIMMLREAADDFAKYRRGRQRVAHCLEAHKIHADRFLRRSGHEEIPEYA